MSNTVNLSVSQIIGIMEQAVTEHTVSLLLDETPKEFNRRLEEVANNIMNKYLRSQEN